MKLEKIKRRKKGMEYKLKERERERERESGIKEKIERESVMIDN